MWLLKLGNEIIDGWMRIVPDIRRSEVLLAVYQTSFRTLDGNLPPHYAEKKEMETSGQTPVVVILVALLLCYSRS